MRESIGSVLSRGLLRLLTWPFRVFDRFLLSPLDDLLLEPRRVRAFEGQLSEIYGGLLRMHDGTLTTGPRRVKAFDYRSAELRFPDRTVTVTRGRGEVLVLVDGVKVYSTFQEDYSTSMQTSASLLEQRWAKLPGGTV